MRALILLSLLCVVGAQKIFFHNNVTGVNTWNRPAEMPLVDPESGRLYWVEAGEATWEPESEALRWVTHYTPDGSPYFSNSKTGATVWERPASLGWSARSADNKFYYNKVTKETTRVRPAELGHHDEERNATYFVDSEGLPTWDAPIESSWTTHHDKEHDRPFYHNSLTGDVVWELPPDAALNWQEWHDEAPEL